MSRDRYDIEYSWDYLQKDGTKVSIPQIIEHVSEADGWSFMKGGADRKSTFSISSTASLTGLEYLLKENKIDELKGHEFIKQMVDDKKIEYLKTKY